MHAKLNVRKLTLIGLGVALNIVGAFIALTLKLPIYLDSLGTILIACLLGPKYAILTGICGSLVSGITFDIYSLYFAPVQMAVGLLGGVLYKKGLLKNKLMPFGVLILTLPASLIGASIAAFLFGGVTSAGSSYIVQLLKVIGVPDVLSVFVTQFFTDYMDKFVAVLFVAAGVSVLPKKVKSMLQSTN